VQSKKTKFDRNHIVEYFTGTRAVDALLENSPWNKTIFESRQHVVNFLETMLRHKFFHRAKKIVITEDELIRIKGIKKKIRDSKDVKDDKKIVEKEKHKEKDNNQINDSKKANNEEKKEGDQKHEKRSDLKKKPKVNYLQLLI
jgi:translocation protein SEC62